MEWEANREYDGKPSHLSFLVSYAVSFRQYIPLLIPMVGCNLQRGKRLHARRVLTPDFIDLGAYSWKINAENLILLGDISMLMLERKTRSSSDSTLWLQEFYSYNAVQVEEDLCEKTKTLLHTRQCIQRRSQIDHILFSPVTAFDCCRHMSGSWTDVSKRTIN